MNVNIAQEWYTSISAFVIRGGYTIIIECVQHCLGSACVAEHGKGLPTSDGLLSNGKGRQRTPRTPEGSDAGQGNQGCSCIVDGKRCFPVWVIMVEHQ